MIGSVFLFTVIWSLKQYLYKHRRHRLITLQSNCHVYLLFVYNVYIVKYELFINCFCFKLCAILQNKSKTINRLLLFHPWNKGKLCSLRIVIKKRKSTLKSDAFNSII